MLKNDTALQNGAEINELRKDINLMLDDEEVWWQQRSRVQWLGEGDRNTKYFHHRDSERRRKNAILGLWNDVGLWCDSKEDVVRTVLSYFEGVYSSSNPSQLEEVTSLIPTKVSEDMNHGLIKEFSTEEVRTAL